MTVCNRPLNCTRRPRLSGAVVIYQRRWEEDGGRKVNLIPLALAISGVQEEGGAADGGREFRVALPREGAHLPLEPHGVPGDVEIRTGDTHYYILPDSILWNLPPFPVLLSNLGTKIALSLHWGLGLILEAMESSCFSPLPRKFGTYLVKDDIGSPEMSLYLCFLVKVIWSLVHCLLTASVGVMRPCPFPPHFVAVVCNKKIRERESVGAVHGLCL